MCVCAYIVVQFHMPLVAAPPQALAAQAQQLPSRQSNNQTNRTA